jgi:hypothetical protein
MTEKKPVERAEEDLREGKRPSTAAGEFVREEMHHIREGKHGARSTKQAIAIGLSKARRAGVPLKPPGEGQTSEQTREAAERAYETGQGQREPRAPSAKRRRAISKALKREGRRAASKSALSRQAKRSRSSAGGRAGHPRPRHGGARTHGCARESPARRPGRRPAPGSGARVARRARPAAAEKTARMRLTKADSVGRRPALRADGTEASGPIE